MVSWGPACCTWRRTLTSCFWSEGLPGIFNREKLYLCRHAPSGPGGEGGWTYFHLYNVPEQSQMTVPLPALGSCLDTHSLSPSRGLLTQRQRPSLRIYPTSTLPSSGSTVPLSLREAAGTKTATLGSRQPWTWPSHRKPSRIPKVIRSRAPVREEDIGGGKTSSLNS